MLLGFKPTKIEDAILETVNFFKTADKFTSHRKKVDKKVKKASEVK